MNYYQEIILLPDVDINPYFLWQKLYQQTHLALVANKNANNESEIAISLPDYDADMHSLGNKMRFFSTDDKKLERLNCQAWLSRLRDDVHIGAILPVPHQIEGYACFRHIKPQGSREKLARRRAKRKNETFEQSLMYFESFEEKKSTLPYIKMCSQTNGHQFYLFIEKKLMAQKQLGFYSCYGLSHSATVPIF